MQFSIGCSIEDLRSDVSLGDLKVLNIENPLHPGYLEHGHDDDVAYLSKSFSCSIVLDGPCIDLNLGSPEPAVRSRPASELPGWKVWPNSTS